MFKLAQNPTFTHDVPIMIPVDGGHQSQDLKTKFRVMPVEETEKYDLATPEGSTAFLLAAVVRFDDVVDQDDKPRLYNDAMRDEFLGYHFIRNGLINAYLKAVMKAQMGN